MSELYALKIQIQMSSKIFLNYKTTEMYRNHLLQKKLNARIFKLERFQLIIVKDELIKFI
jgi:hypothetical protein